MVKPVMVQPAGKKMCCHRMAGMQGNSTCPKSSGKSHSDGCDKQACSMMLSCSLCGYFIVEPLQVRPHPAKPVSKPVSLYIIGDLSAYHPSDWKPPKTC
jgi:hypothetical protein